jgi:alkaline phosphatase
MRTLLFSIAFLTLQTFLGQDKTPNIILMIGDGMGLSQISAGMYTSDNSTALEGFEYVGLSKTHALNQLITDSAASGTAMACGVKTLNGVIGIDGRNNKHSSILELYKEKGYATGLLATSSIAHATPASFYAKVPSRRQYEDIALQLSEHNVDLFVGGGKTFF